MDKSDVELRCSSLGTSPFTRVIWYRDGVPVDSTYMITGASVINTYIFTAYVEDNSKLECRVEFDPTNLEMTAPANIRVQGWLS